MSIYATLWQLKWSPEGEVKILFEDGSTKLRFGGPVHE
jgi:hypothetical protein